MACDSMFIFLATDLKGKMSIRYVREIKRRMSNISIDANYIINHDIKFSADFLRAYFVKLVPYDTKYTNICYTCVNRFCCSSLYLLHDNGVGPVPLLKIGCSIIFDEG